MSDNSNTTLDTGRWISNRVQELHETFNTNPEFGLMGMLKDGTQARTPQDQYAQQTAQTVAAVAAPAAAAEPSAEQITNYMEPLNASLQQMQQKQLQEMQGLRNQIGELSKMQQQFAQQPPAEGQAADPYAAKINEFSNQYNKLYSTVLYDRAKHSLQGVAQQYPDSALSENDLQSIWNNPGFNPSSSEQVNWDDHWKREAAFRRQGKLEDRLKSLESENVKLKTSPPRPNGLEQLSAVPQRSAASAGLPSPTGNSGNSEEDAIYHEANKKMATGKFMGFNRALYDSQNSLRLRGAI